MYLWWYGLSYTLGFLILFLWIYRVRDSLDISHSQAYDLSIVLAFGVLVGGRLVEVLFYEWAYYGAHPFHILWIWLGGMSTHGILLGGTVGLWVFCRLNNRSFLQFADQIVIPAAVIMGLGRLGNFIDGQIVGSVTDVWWAVRFPDAEDFRHAVVLYDGLKNLLLVPALLLIWRFEPPRGVMLGCFLIGYGYIRFFIDFFREYRVELLGIPPGQEFNIGMTLAGLAIVVWSFKTREQHLPSPSINKISAEPDTTKNHTLAARRVLFLFLLGVPLVIPSDWTQDVPDRYGKRHQGMEHSKLYPVITETKKPN